MRERLGYNEVALSTKIFLISILQLNYEFLRKCVASGPVTPMGSASWENILSYIPAKYISNPRMQPLIKELDQEIHQQYEETIRKTTSKSEGSLSAFTLCIFYSSDDVS